MGVVEMGAVVMVVVVTVAAAGRIQAIPTWTPKKGWRLPSTMMKSQRS